MKKTITRLLLIIFYPLIVLLLFVKNYFTWIMLSLLLGSLFWFALENYRLYTQGRAEYTSYLPSLFKRDRKGDKTVLSYMVFDFSKLTGGPSSVAPLPVKKRAAPTLSEMLMKSEANLPLSSDETVSEPEYQPVSDIQSDATGNSVQ